MNVNFEAMLAGMRRGKKDDKIWGNVVLDDPFDPLSRIQLFTRDEKLIQKVADMLPGTRVDCTARLYTNKDGYLGASLDRIDAV